MKNSKMLVSEMENMQTDKIYKIVKVGKKSGKHTTLRKYLTLNEAQRYVMQFTDISRSMVVYYKM